MEVVTTLPVAMKKLLLLLTPSVRKMDVRRGNGNNIE
jgi:hypothetical protein